jgi:hypothetical protein
MAKGMKDAMADLSDRGRDTERQFDIEFGYEDENPMDRHVRMYLTPRKNAVGDGKVRSTVQGLDVLVDEAVEGAMLGGSPESGRTGGADFRPGLLNFTKSKRVSIPAFSRTISEGMDGLGMNTPDSEASFEVIKADDYISLYGGMDRSSHASSATSTMSTITASISTAVITNRLTLDKPLPPVPGTLQRPSLLRPRSSKRVHPYEHAGAREEEDDWLSGRSTSEMMVAQAGLRCQKGRAIRKGRI